ncbi:MAG: DUF547 domain-containing protein [Ignavibacteriaceae bacterium]|nr:DUF547 domain-containing protein [Ignavibacteriaceae bacterium]
MKTISFITLLLFSITGCNYSYSSGFDHSKFDALLKANVDENGMVNYSAFKNNNDFEDYIKSIAEANVNILSKEDKLAFYLNAYNATVIKNVLDYSPITSPMDVDGFFKKIPHKIAWNEITLDKLEYDYAMKIESVLVHFGLVCAAQSCPKLLRKAYDGKIVFQQLEENGKTFLNDRSKNHLDKENKVLYLSEIFRWFAKYFEERFGSLQKAAHHFMNERDKKFLSENKVEVKFNKYNWKLNSQ